MRIAADISGIQDSTEPGLKELLHQLWKKLIEEHPETAFYFLTRKDQSIPFAGMANAHILPQSPSPSSLFYRYWRLVKLPSLLKKIKADLFITGSSNILPDAKLPQAMLLTDPGLLTFDRRRAIFLKRAGRLFVFSAGWKTELIKLYGLPPDRITVLPPAIPAAIGSLTWEEKQKVKDRYSAGKEYFLYAGSFHPGHNLTNLLKGFSIFKKRQQSGIKLLLAGDLAQHDKGFAGTLQHYKYREDVVVTGTLSETEKDRLFAAAYAIADPAILAGPGILALQAASAGVPLLAAAGQPFSAEAYLPADMTDPVDIASRLMQVYKDESLRGELIQRATAGLSAFNLAQTASRFWNSLIQQIQ